jgi:hypothetical protein
MSAISFARFHDYLTRPARKAKTRRSVLAFEPLEDRLVLNNRFVIPGTPDGVTHFSTLQAAFAALGLKAGDVIQIEPGSNPGHIHNADIPAIKNLTIQGNPNSDLVSIPYFILDDEVKIGSAQTGFTLKHLEVDVVGGTLQFSADGTIAGCQVKNEFAGIGIQLLGTSAAVISDSTLENVNPPSSVGDLVQITPAANSHNLITDNQFTSLAGSEEGLLGYDGGGAGAMDIVGHNSFVCMTKVHPTRWDYLMQVANAAEGLTIEGNEFTNNDPGGADLLVEPGKNIHILDNVLTILNGQSGSAGICLDGQTVPLSDVVVGNNQVSVGQGRGISLWTEDLSLTSIAIIEGNDLQNDSIGIQINQGEGQPGSVARFDLGVGMQGSLGANDFRGDATAIDAEADLALGPITAEMNIYGVADPTTVIQDNNTHPGLAVVDASSPLTGAAAYVETLYLDFLHRAGDTNNPSDAGGWVKLLGQGTPISFVANQLARCTEALNYQVNALYHQFLGRAADSGGQAYFVSTLQGGGTLEGVSQSLLASAEYQSHFQSSTSFVQSLYQNLLQRVGSAGEISQAVAQLQQIGRAGLAREFLFSQEYRGLQVADDYAHLLRRSAPPTSSEVNYWTGSGLDLLTLDAVFATTQEFQQNG